MELKAIIFDMGGTIETFGYTQEQRLKAASEIQTIMKDAGIVLGLSDEALLDTITRGIKKYHDHCLKSLVEYPAIIVWREYILRDFSYDPTALEKIADELMVFVENNFYDRNMRPEVPEVLKALKQMGLKIGLISNVNSRGQVPYNLKRYGIIEYFDPIVLSSEYGIRKPDPSIFHYAARLMNVPTSACAYVGDRIVRDILGAQKAGYRLAIQIEHDFEHGEEDTGAVPDAIISNMTQLIDIVKTEMARPRIEPDSQIRALLFDAGDILYYRPKKENKFVNFLKELGLDDKWEQIQKKKDLKRQAYTGQISHDEFHLTYLQLLGITDPELVKRGKALLDEENLDVEFFEGVKETLQTLKQKGFMLGIITNTANSIRSKLSWFEVGGFGDVWDSIISSVEIGVIKPFPEIYQAALTQLGLSSDQAVFVGHRISELNGAKASGLQTIAYNYDEGAQADYYVTEFREILEIPILSISQKIEA